MGLFYKVGIAKNYRSLKHSNLEIATLHCFNKKFNISNTKQYSTGSPNPFSMAIYMGFVESN
jgi:hypothetical protein